MQSTFPAKLSKRLSMLVLLAMITACTADSGSSAKPELLIYCGITMAHPMAAIAKILEKEQNVKITITQGGSEDLYQSLKTSRQGDLYLPGSESYRTRHLEEGLLGDAVMIGYNQAVFVVAEGNPKGIDGDLNNMLRKDIAVIVCNPESGSIGRETKRILEKKGIYEGALNNSVFLTTDSRNLNRAIKDGKADLAINWRATAVFEENADKLDIIELDPEYAEPKKLVLNLLTFSKHPDIAKRFMEYAASEQGQAIFRQHGFHDRNATFGQK